MPNSIVNGITIDHSTAGDGPPEFFDCPAHQDERGLVRCRLPAEVSRRFIMRSTDGPVESVVIRCPAGHFFHGPTEFLSLASAPPQTTDTVNHPCGVTVSSMS
jgi:hypothetical protein